MLQQNSSLKVKLIPFPLAKGKQAKFLLQI